MVVRGYRLAKLCGAYCPLFSAAGRDDAVIVASFGNSTISFLIFCFVFAYALDAMGFLGRCDLWFISGLVARRSPWPFCSFFGRRFVHWLLHRAHADIFIVLCTHRAVGRLVAVQEREPAGHGDDRRTAIVTSISCGMTPIAHNLPIDGIRIL